MRASLVVLHGYTMNAETMREHMSALAQRLPAGMNIVYAPAPQTCSEGAVERFYRGSSLARLPPPYLTWWDASDDGSEYRGWEETRDAVRALVARHSPAGLLGFSQGAIVAAAVAATTERDATSAPSFVVLVAGRTPRASALEPYFREPVPVPSLHVWGRRDGMASGSRELSGRFKESTREVVVWSGGHRVPGDGPGAEAIAAFVGRYARA